MTNKEGYDCTTLIIVIMIILILFGLAELAIGKFIDDFPVSHWLDVKSVESKVFDPNVPEKHIFTVWPCYDTTKDDYLVIRTKDPNTFLEVTKFHRNRMNYVDFAIFARQYKGDPNYIPPSDPCEPNLAEMLDGVTDPNLITLIKSLMKD